MFPPGATAIGFYSGGEIVASSAGALLLIFQEPQAEMPNIC